MPDAYYLDTCIWRDHFENRFGPEGRPLGKYATNLFYKIIENQDKLLFSDLLVEELKIAFSKTEIEYMLQMIFMMKILIRTEASPKDHAEASKIAKERDLPLSDVLHAIIARNNNAVLVTQDKHFNNLKDIVRVIRPEDI